MWGHSVQFWQSAADWLLFATAVLGTLVIVTSLSSSLISSRASKMIQAEADQSIATAQEGIAEAIAETARANQRAAEATRAAAEAMRQTAQARLEREQLKAQLAWRDWPPELVSRLQGHLAAHPTTVTIQYVANDPETAFFAIQINNAFHEAGWETRMLSASYTVMLLTGIFVIGSDEAAVENTRAAFQATGINHSTDTPPEPVMKSGDGRPSDVLIIVGAKARPR